MKSEPISFAAEVSDAQVRAIEDAYSDFGPTRRAGLAILARDTAHMLAALRDDDETCDAFAELMEALTSYIERLDGMRQMMDCAHARLLLSLDAEARRRGHAILDEDPEAETQLNPKGVDTSAVLRRLQIIANIWTGGRIDERLFEAIELAMARTGCPELANGEGVA